MEDAHMKMKKINLRSELITSTNVKKAIQLQNSIFPKNKAKQIFFESIKDNIEAKVPNKYRLQYFLVNDQNDDTIGLWGHYIEDRKDECWLGWFGVRHDKRNCGYGSSFTLMK